MTSDYHINKVVATHTIIPVIVLFLAIIIIPILIYFLNTNGFLKLDHILYNGGLIGMVIIIPFAFYFTISSSENKQIRLFNQYKLKE